MSNSVISRQLLPSMETQQALSSSFHLPLLALAQCSILKQEANLKACFHLTTLSQTKIMILETWTLMKAWTARTAMDHIMIRWFLIRAKVSIEQIYVCRLDFVITFVIVATLKNYD